MFTGIIEAVGQVAAITMRDGDMRLTIRTGDLDLSDAAIGDSIATSGVCLTAVEHGRDYYVADVSAETLAHTTLGQLKKGDAVNLEKAMLPTTRFGGHMVSGHVDGVGKIVSRAADARSIHFTVRAPDALSRYIAKKGSICIDGVSLTVNAVEGAVFDINIVPHTAAHTTLGHISPGQLVNLEVDVIARYLERLLTGAEAAPAGVTAELLARHGFLE